MKRMMAAAAMLVLVVGAGSAMARGPAVQDRGGAREEVAAYRLRDVGSEATATTATHAAAKTPTTQMASCPKCRDVWETKPMSSGRSTPETKAVMQCEHCTNAVTNFLKSGEFKHVCATCGDKVEEMCMKH